MQMANPDLYRMPHDPYSRHAHQMSFAQPAPRQRTAIACRYCRRRKIRCSGFESSQDGRCSNCQRFNQECIFTPVSSQTQAFVPAHTQYPQMRQIPGRGGGRPPFPSGGHVQLYGAHGQPINLPSDYPLGNPSHPSFAGRSGSPTFSYEDYESGESRGEERERERGVSGEIHPPSLPPLPRRSSQGDYPSHWNREPVSPPTLPLAARAYSPPIGPGGYGESAPSTFYPPTPTRRTSPPTPYSGERPTSISPHPTIHPPMWPGPPRPESAGPSSAHTVPSIHPMQLANIIDQSQPQQRSAHDNEMLNQLKRGL
ncbi:C6 zinc finger domain-containing protein [Peziza echinospora]|nr:C6 zinc finger domain-containing protein [Peziza echinospora]